MLMRDEPDTYPKSDSGERVNIIVYLGRIRKHVSRALESIHTP